MQRLWPNNELLIRTSDAPHGGVSVHHGRGGSRAKEVDILIPGARGDSWAETRGFRQVEHEVD